MLDSLDDKILTLDTNELELLMEDNGLFFENIDIYENSFFVSFDERLNPLTADSIANLIECENSSFLSNCYYDDNLSALVMEAYKDFDLKTT